ncbi:helix-turn-helix transcriptional regulator [Streptacidiphilus sp. PB12-B1b]|uniref:winged helix-turn-helix transcriptional regulator n=1 Tax=Streptacidiphilus sp. PB12-B1b TaxID=2705012 RepID=UPI0015FB47E6|nr:helix-turn-helix domain-containing protein [Streptacidiphilus sp. PB12-B1b]QMU78206.1 helix-turn-helix transcriptional regulator [Streptacidiphilus sp. PB12-B1b]
MKRTSFAHWPCSIARTMDLLGDWWTPLVLREVSYGIQRFDALQESLGIARNTLSDRLRRLVDEGLLEKQPYQTDPVRYDYVPTEKGRDFYTVLLAMNRWGDRWLSGEAGPPVTHYHDVCGQESHAKVVCAACGEPMTVENAHPRLGPGYPPHLARRPEIRARFED